MTREEMKYFRQSLKSNAERDRAQASELQAHATALEQAELAIAQLIDDNDALTEQNNQLKAELETEKKRNTIQIARLEGIVIEKVDNMIAQLPNANSQNNINYGNIDTTDVRGRNRACGYIHSTSDELLRQCQPEGILAGGE